MTELIEKHVADNNIYLALEQCQKERFDFLAQFISKIFNYPIKSEVIRVMLICNWCSSEQLANLWNKMSYGNYCWKNIRLVWTEPVDYYVIINSPGSVTFNNDKKRTIVFRMEPNMTDHKEIWGEWADPADKDFLKVYRHEKGELNNCEWHLSKSYTELIEQPVVKNAEYNKVLSTVLSGKYKDVGQVKRIDFIKFMERKGDIDVHVYGQNRWDYKNYKGSLPYHCKDNAIFPYKYTFNAENCSKANYLTEKLLDGILGECLVFYWGCFNAREYIDERAFVYLELSDFEKAYKTVKTAIEEDWHTQRLPYIREAKKKILNELQFFPRLEKLFKKERPE